MYNNIADYRKSTSRLLRFKISGALHLSAKVLIFLSLASINELAFMITSISHVGMALVIIPAGFLFLYYWPYAIANQLILQLFGPILTYVLIAITYGMLSGNVYFSLVRTYFFSGVLMTIIAIHIIKSNKELVDNIVKFSRGVLLLASVSVILSPYYYPYMQELPSALGDQRFSGFFLNPNEGSLSSVLFLNFILYRPYEKRMFNLFAIALVIVAIALMLSKTGIILFFASLMLFLLLKRKGMLMLFAVALLTLSLQFLPDTLSNRIGSSDFWLSLSDRQLTRLDSLYGFLQGRLDRHTTTYRIDMWNGAIPIIADHFPHGTGLGTFYYGGNFSYQNENIYRQGVHNMYLMIVGEAGFVAFALFIVCYGHLLALALASKDKLPLAIIFNALLFSITSHNSFEIRFLVVLFAIAVGLLSKKSERVSHPISS